MSGKLLRSAIATLLLAALMTPAVNALCAGGVSCPMMQRPAQVEAPCHPREAISANHDCCMQSGEVATDREADQTLRKLAAVPRAAWFGLAAVGATGESPRPLVSAPRSASLFLLHSSFLT